MLMPRPESHQLWMAKWKEIRRAKRYYLVDPDTHPYLQISSIQVRYPVILSNKEKLIARTVCMTFKQMVCGFDLLRANGKSIVCDVNGFSFVKNSSKYYDDCAKILGNMILRALAPTLHIPWAMPFQLDDPPIVPTTVGKM